MIEKNLISIWEEFLRVSLIVFFFFQAEDGIRDFHVTGVQTCALPILPQPEHPADRVAGRLAQVFALLHYFLDPEIGLCHARLQTWFPFTLQVCLNGRERSEERRVGKECRSRGSQYEYKEKV